MCGVSQISTSADSVRKCFEARSSFWGGSEGKAKGEPTLLGGCLNTRSGPSALFADGFGGFRSQSNRYLDPSTFGA